MFSKIFLAISVAIVLGFFLLKGKNTNKQEVLTIGILQTASHPALDRVREGFVQELQRGVAQPIRCVVQNAEGSVAQAQSIATSFHSRRNIHAILAIGTPAVQAIVRCEKEKPIFVAAVSDPAALGLTQETSNVCGTTDRIDTTAQAQLVKELVPDATRVTILYTLSESNSQLMAPLMEASLQEQGLSVSLVGIHTESEIAAAVRSMASKTDALVIPTDNLLASSMPLLVKETLRHKLPFIVNDPLCVLQGALAATGVDYLEQGKQTAIIAKHVLLDKHSPQQEGILHPKGLITVINQHAVDTLEIKIEDDLLTRSQILHEGGSHVR